MQSLGVMLLIKQNQAIATCLQVVRYLELVHILESSHRSSKTCYI